MPLFVSIGFMNFDSKQYYISFMSDSFFAFQRNI